MFNLFLNEEKEIFNYSEGELKVYNDKFYIANNNIFIPKGIVANIFTVSGLPEDFEIGKYKYVNYQFVENENFVPYIPPEPVEEPLAEELEECYEEEF